MRWLHLLSTLGLGACLADDMGLGKTMQVIALMLVLRNTGYLRGPSLVVAPASLLASPITWKAHHAALLLVFACLVATALERRRWSALATFLCAYWVACGLLSEEVVGKAGKQALQSASVVTGFTIALVAVVVVLSRRESAAASHEAT